MGMDLECNPADARYPGPVQIERQEGLSEITMVNKFDVALCRHSFICLHFLWKIFLHEKPIRSKFTTYTQRRTTGSQCEQQLEWTSSAMSTVISTNQNCHEQLQQQQPQQPQPQPQPQQQPNRNDNNNNNNNNNNHNNNNNNNSGNVSNKNSNTNHNSNIINNDHKQIDRQTNKQAGKQTNNQTNKEQRERERDSTNNTQQATNNKHNTHTQETRNNKQETPKGTSNGKATASIPVHRVMRLVPDACMTERSRWWCTDGCWWTADAAMFLGEQQKFQVFCGPGYNMEQQCTKGYSAIPFETICFAIGSVDWTNSDLYSWRGKHVNILKFSGLLDSGSFPTARRLRGHIEADIYGL